MPRTARASVGGVCYHVINRGNGREKVFHKPREDWEWSSLGWWERAERPAFLHNGPVDRGRRWAADVNRPMTAAEAIRRSVNRGTHWGTKPWQKRTATRLGLESSLRPRGRPRKAAEK